MEDTYEDMFLSGHDYKPKRSENPDGLIKLRAISPDIVATDASLEGKHAAHHLGRIAPDFIKNIERMSDIRGPIVPWMHREFFTSVVGKSVANAVNTVLRTDFTPSATPRGANPVMHVPTYAMYYHALDCLQPGNRLLILGASAKDSGRFFSMMARHFAAKRINIFLATNYDKVNVNIPDGINFERVSDWEMYFNSVRGQRYDCIIMPGSMGTVLEGSCDSERRTVSRHAIVSHLRSMVHEGGFVLGSFHDPDAVKQMGNQEVFTGGIDVSVTTELPYAGLEGAVMTRVGDKNFMDYRFTPEKLLDSSEYLDESNLWDARVYLKDHKPPPELRSCALDPRLEPIRIWCWTPGKLRDFDVSTQSYRAWPEALLATDIDADSVLELCVDVNRGKPFTDDDLFYMNPSRIIVTPKADGVEAVIAFREKDTCLKVRGYPKAFAVPWKGPTGLILQIELLGHHPEYPLGAVLTDVIAGSPINHGYVTRLKYAAKVIEDYKIPIKIPHYNTLTDNVIWPECAYPFDGFVLNWDSARVFKTSRGCGPARYVKMRYTYETRDAAGRIVEKYVDTNETRMAGDMVVVRHDKTTVTSNEEMIDLKRAWNVHQFRERIIAMSHKPDSLRLKEPDERGEFHFDNAELCYLWAPWREMSYEQEIYILHGEPGVRALIKGRAAGMLRFIAEHPKRDHLEELGIITDFNVDVIMSNPSAPVFTALFGSMADCARAMEDSPGGGSF